MIYLSICIPTKNRIEYIKKTIESIVNDGVDKSLYQIVISDNSDNDQTALFAAKLDSEGFNIKYFKNPRSGFYNSVQSLLLGDGELLKLHNDYSAFTDGGFAAMVDSAVKNIHNREMLFFTNGELKSGVCELDCSNLDSFVLNASYLITWSSSFSIWKDELSKLKTESNEVDEMFPHTSLILQMQCSKYKIIDKVLFKNLSVSKKGGYNIFYNFCILFLDMLKFAMIEKKITEKTFKKVKKDLFYKFILVWYYRTIVDKSRSYTFDNTNAALYIKQAYGVLGLIGVILATRSKYTLMSILNIFRRTLS